MARECIDEKSNTGVEFVGATRSPRLVVIGVSVILSATTRSKSSRTVRALLPAIARCARAI
jgi:hypothetical protein